MAITVAQRPSTVRTALQVLIVAAVAAFLGFLATQPATPVSSERSAPTQQPAASFPPPVTGFPGEVTIPGGGPAPTSFFYQGRPTHIIWLPVDGRLRPVPA